MKWTGIYILIFAVGMLEYLPFPNLPVKVVDWVQSNSIYLPWVAMAILLILAFRTSERMRILALAGALCFAAIFPSILRDGMNRFIVMLNDEKELKEVSNSVAGTKMNREETYVSYSWNLMSGDYEELIYMPNHGQQNDYSEREITEVLNENWFIQRTGLFE